MFIDTERKHGRRCYNEKKDNGETYFYTMDTTLETTQLPSKYTKGVTLSKEIALSIQRHVYLNESYYFDDVNEVRLKLENEDGTFRDITITCTQYDNWVARRTIVEGIGKHLRQIIDEAKEKRIRDREEAERKEQIRLAKDTLNALLKLPIEYTSVDRELKRNNEGKMTEVKRYTRKDISAPLVAGKVKGLMFALERLEPEHFARKDETKNTHIVGVFSLADLRQKSQDQE